MNQAFNFVYLDVGKSPLIKIELSYSISTLLAEIPAGNRIILYTDKPEEYRSFPIEIRDVNKIVPSVFGKIAYVYRLKPCVLLHALEESGVPCIFIDSDTYLLPGFFNALQSKLGEGALLGEVKTSTRLIPDIPYSQPLPHSSEHSKDPGLRLDGNSGLIGVQPGRGKAILEDAISIIDQALETGKWPRTLEQSAILEAIWVHQIKIDQMGPWLVHYSTQSKKRYMRFQIKRLLKRRSGVFIVDRPSIKFNQPRVKLYQYFYDVQKTYNKVMKLFSPETEV